ncbi:hypothetical protein CRG98_012558 [Punica granatum]|uniref:RBR-type E3 ubiquitin transferase n=1 Tax=Punica granatum TaxID=22663 RepID=A0A2I0KFE2_PUNGR|nr:hypothetical protein CRG98_012558 [Punica granatum]
MKKSGRAVSVRNFNSSSPYSDSDSESESGSESSSLDSYSRGYSDSSSLSPNFDSGSDPVSPSSDSYSDHYSDSGFYPWSPYSDSNLYRSSNSSSSYSHLNSDTNSESPSSHPYSDLSPSGTGSESSLDSYGRLSFSDPDSDSKLHLGQHAAKRNDNQVSHIKRECRNKRKAEESSWELHTLKRGKDGLQTAGQQSTKLTDGSTDSRGPSDSFCRICMEEKEADEMFIVSTACSHSFCSICIIKHVSNKIKENLETVCCPGNGCKNVVEIDSCGRILPSEVLSHWEKLLCEATIPEHQKYYCPFRDCSVMLVNDTEELIRRSECPYCHRMFCTQCRMPWHEGGECNRLRKLTKDEHHTSTEHEIKGRRCPRCNFYLERKSGRCHMKCRYYYSKPI